MFMARAWTEGVRCRALHDFKQKQGVDLLVLDSTFLSYKTVARRMLAHRWATWLFSPLATLLVSDEYASEEALKSNHIPS